MRQARAGTQHALAPVAQSQGCQRRTTERLFNLPPDELPLHLDFIGRRDEKVCYPVTGERDAPLSHVLQFLPVFGGTSGASSNGEIPSSM